MDVSSIPAMPSQSIQGVSAWDLVMSNQALRWGAKPGAFLAQAYPVDYSPKFPISESDSFFCVGSCFARNVEEQLLYRGLTVLSRRLISPGAEWPGARPNGLVNKFTTHSILNEVRWLKGAPVVDERMFVQDSDGHWADLHLAATARPVSLERAIERRSYLLRDYFPQMLKADVLVVTLGLNEVWWDNESGLHLNAAPSRRDVRAAPDRFRLEVTTVADNLQALEQIREGLRGLKPDLRIVITVSPVPLDISFTGQDPVVANARSKAVLRVSAEEFALAHDDVDYFPSYEMVSLAPRTAAYAPDCRHVADATVDVVIGKFLLSHGLPSDHPHPGFSEVAYLAANPDVNEAVRAGDLVSGWQHWERLGRSEGRNITPPDGPTRAMIKVGVT